MARTDWLYQWVAELEASPRGFAPVDRDYRKRKILMVRFPFSLPVTGWLMIRNLYIGICWRLFDVTTIQHKKWYQKARLDGYLAGIEYGKTLAAEKEYIAGYEKGAKDDTLNQREKLQCRYKLSWAGRCKNPIEGGFCAEHSKEIYKCLCGKKATEECGTAGSVVCGRPLCGDEKCKEEHEKQGHYFL